MKWHKLCNEFDAEYEMYVVAFSHFLASSHFRFRISNDRTKFYIRTNHSAPQYKIITVDLADQKREFVDLVPENKDAHLASVVPVDKDKFAVVYKRNVRCLLSNHINSLQTMDTHTIGEGRDLRLLKHRFASRTPGT
jgi:Prolyl oligopeptidase, N-terminal beta-propeller domain.